MKLKKINTKQLIIDLELPEGTEFLGYAIHIERSDEYLATCEIDNGIMRSGWTKKPEMAKHFKKIDNIKFIKTMIKPEAIVMWVFDTGVHIYTTQAKDYK